MNFKNLTTLLCLMLMFSCKTEKKEKVEAPQKIAYQSFGEKITDTDVLASTKMLEKFNDLKVGDTIDIKFSSKINEVCSKKGCWMKLSLDSTKQTMVRFKDYGFFMPLDSEGSDVIVEGKAFVKETSIDELRHYAEDAGKSKEEIAKIIAPKTTFSFTANGVLLK
ncbi:uncharacterized protein DUF4920 [Lutibacter sp. Hel_I_33_5]|uniref:DUF4920 domain-containing protein n=1 Tax=Lutibacter sp. Hel_I_33_5 TaxID=1566289 RepID=UPI0011ACC996|nr:uncharacterized protein DUF4920 [Lutibacter sp. Hel_I_33_5]